MDARILVVDDEPEIADLVEVYLKSEGCTVFKCGTGTEALAVVRNQALDLAILDVMLPDISGFTLCGEIRKEHHFPVLMLTAKAEDMDKITGLTIGADDYITKPFAIEELLARIRAALRKRPAQAAEPPRSLLTAGPLTMDTDRHEVSVNGEGVELTRREFDLLRYLLENKERVISRESLLDHVWGFDFVGETNEEDVYIRFLRAKIDEHFGIKLIHTVRGVGYVIREEGQ